MIVVLCHTNETESWSVIKLCEDALGVFLCIVWIYMWVTLALSVK